MGLNAALHASGRSLEIFSAGIQVAGQNIANANTPGYIREQIDVTTNYPYQQGNLIFGTGAKIDGIKQQIDLYLESRIHAASTEYQAIDAHVKIYQQLEAEIGELTSTDISTQLNDFLGAINDVINQPEDPALRQIIIQQGVQLSNEISLLRTRVDELRTAQTTRVNELIDEANVLIEEIDSLNTQITKTEVAGLLGSDAGDLRTQRYNALTRLSEIIPITFRERSDGGIDVHTGSDYLVLAGTTQKLESIIETNRGVGVVQIQLTETKSPITGSGGEIQGTIEGRDNILGGFVDDLDTFTSTLISEFNRIHTAGQGIKPFESISGTVNTNDTSVVLTDSDAGLAFLPNHGSFEIHVKNQQTGAIEISTINIDLDGLGGNDTTLNDVLADIDGITNLSANFSTHGLLQITADNGYEFSFTDDSSGILNSLGINTFFTGNDSGSIGVNDLLLQDHAYLATSQGGGPADGSNFVELAQFIDQPVEGLSDQSLDEYYNSIMSLIAQASASEEIIADGAKGYLDSLNNQRHQFSGVSIDEEMISIMDFQHGYQTAARLISTIDELFTILLSM